VLDLDRVDLDARRPRSPARTSRTTRETYAAMRAMLTSKGADPGDEEVIGDAVALAGVARYPARVKCALLGWMALADALAQTGVDLCERRSAMSDTDHPAANVADVEEAMRDVVDPELGINVVDLGLVYGITVDPQNHAVIDMTLTSAACPLTDVIEDQTDQALDRSRRGHRINWVWMPPWGPDKITDDGREQLRALGFNI
jgi:metal-sulfur cluster biosynthetic enzyme